VEKRRMQTAQRNRTTVTVKGYGVSFEYSKTVERPLEISDKNSNNLCKGRNTKGKKNENNS